MSNRIAESFIQDLVLRSDIVQLIDGYVPLKKAGRNFVACCPFHTEKTPSFSVNSQKQFYHCFGCGASGNVISFLMEYAHKNFIEAVEILAARLGLSIPQGEYNAKQAKHSSLYDVLRAAMDFYRHELEQDPKAMNYFQQRGIDAETAQRFALGAAADQWDRLYNHLINKKFSAESIAAVGLSVRSDSGREYDRFRGRVMFPIRDRRGRPLGFGGRSMDAEAQPKYLNSPETPVFHKGGELYGLYEAEQVTRSLEHLIIVEGYMDVIALSQHGIVNVVATLGTATTSEHMQRVFRLTSRIIFCFDGDNAGQKAAWRALEAALPVLSDGREVRFIFLPLEEDPDSLVRKQGKEAFNAYLDSAMPLSDFFFNQLSQNLSLETPDGRARLASLATPLLEKMPLGVFRTLMLDELAKKTRLSISSVQKIMPAKPELPSYRPAETAPTARKTPVRLGLTLLIQYPHLVQCIENKVIFKEVVVAGIELFAAVVDYLQTHAKQTTASLLEHWRDQTEGRYLERLAVEELMTPETGVQAEFKGILLYLQKLAVEQTIEMLWQKASSVGLDDEEKSQLQLLIQQQKNNE
jgi:DNA primase